MNQSPTFDLIVIGGGPPGGPPLRYARREAGRVCCSDRAWQHGRHVHERRPRADACRPGSAARLMSNASQYADYGITVSPPELDFQRLLACTQAIVYEMHEKKQLISHLEAAGVKGPRRRG